MMRRDSLREAGIYLVTLFIAFYFSWPLNALGQQLSVNVKDNLITIDVKDADFSDVLKEIEKASGIKITISPDMPAQRISSFRLINFPLDEALRWLWNNTNSYCVYTLAQDASNKDKETLKEIKVYGNVIGTKPYNGKTTTIAIPYGDGEKEVGLLIPQGEGLITGPGSFSVDASGNIYICDSVEARVQVFSPTGQHLRFIPLQGQAFYKDATSRSYRNMAIEIAVDGYGFIYIYDNEEKLYQYNGKGEVISSIQVDTRPWEVIYNLEVIKDGIYIGVCGGNVCGYMLQIAKILPDKSLADLSDAEKKNRDPKDKHIGFRTSKKYLLKSKDLQREEYSVKDKDSPTSKILSFPSKGMAFMQLVGEDGNGDLFVKAKRGVGNEYLTELHKFNADGDYLSTMQMPEGGGYFKAFKYFLINNDGTIYNFSPQKDKLLFTIFNASSR